MTNLVNEDFLRIMQGGLIQYLFLYHDEFISRREITELAICQRRCNEYSAEKAVISFDYSFSSQFRFFFPSKGFKLLLCIIKTCASYSYYPFHSLNILQNGRLGKKKGHIGICCFDNLLRCSFCCFLPILHYHDSVRYPQQSLHIMADYYHRATFLPER